MGRRQARQKGKLTYRSWWPIWYVAANILLAGCFAGKGNQLPIPTGAAAASAEHIAAQQAPNVEQVLLTLLQQVSRKAWPDAVASLQWLEQYSKRQPLRLSQLQRWDTLQQVVANELAELVQTSQQARERRYWLLLRSQLRLEPVQLTIDAVQATSDLGQQEKNRFYQERSTTPGSASLAGALAFHLGAHIAVRSLAQSWHMFTNQLCTYGEITHLGWPVGVSNKLWKEPLEEALQTHLQAWLQPCGNHQPAIPIQIQVERLLMLEQKATWPGAIAADGEVQAAEQEQILYLTQPANHATDGIAPILPGTALPLPVHGSSAQEKWIVRVPKTANSNQATQVHFERSMKRRLVRMELLLKIADQAPIRLDLEQDVADQGHPSLIVSQELRPPDQVQVTEMSTLLRQLMQKAAEGIEQALHAHHQQLRAQAIEQAQQLRQHDLPQAVEIALQYWVVHGHLPVALQGILLERYGMPVEQLLLQLATALGVEPLLLQQDGLALRQALLPAKYVQPAGMVEKALHLE